MLSKNIKNRPMHPFPYIITGTNGSNKKYNTINKYKKLTLAELKVINLLRSGNRIIFNIHRKRGLVYNFHNGFNHIMEVTVRMLSSLIRLGILIPVLKEEEYVYYILKGQDKSWYLED